MARDLEKIRLYNQEYYKKKKKEKEDKRIKAAKQAANQRAYRKRKKEKMAAIANENSVVNGNHPHTPPRYPPLRAGSSPLHSIANNGVTLSDARLNMFETRLVNSAKAKRSNIALLKEAMNEAVDKIHETVDKMHEAVDKANDNETENTDKFFQLITGDNQNRFEETETRPYDMDIDHPPGATPNSKPPPVPVLAKSKRRRTNSPGDNVDMKFTTPSPSKASVPWAFPSAGAPTNSGLTFGATASTDAPSKATVPWTFPPAGAPTFGATASDGFIFGATTAPINGGAPAPGFQFSFPAPQSTSTSTSKSKRQRTDSPDGFGFTVKRHRN